MERKIQKISNSYLATLPKEWIKTYKLGKGDKIYYTLLSDGMLLVSGQKKTKKTFQKELNYSEDTFERAFFRLYLLGYDFIKIRIKNSNQARKIHEYLEKFINVEIIEEDARYLNINNYDIDTLTPKKCFRRIFFLTGNMHEKLKEIYSTKDNAEKEMLKRHLKETDKRLSGFYFILVRDVRKHFSNRAFLNEEEPLVRYMDFRMAAEKLERIADLIIYISQVKEKLNDDESKMLDKIFALNKDAVFAFLKNDFVATDELNKRANKMIEELSDARSVFRYNLLEILNYIKDILNLVGGAL